MQESLLMFRFALHWQILVAMIIGASVGLALNVGAGKFELPEPRPVSAGKAQPYGFVSPISLPEGTFWSSDSPSGLRMQIVQHSAAPRVRRVFVGALEDEKRQKQAKFAALQWPDLPPGATLADVRAEVAPV